MTISKKHFQAIANILGTSYQNNLHKYDDEKLLSLFCDFFKKENSNFNKSTFLKAIDKANGKKAEDIEQGLYDLDELNITKNATLAKKAIDEIEVINTNTIIENLQKENKVLQSKVKTYEQDISKRLDEIEVQNFENDLNSVKN